MKTLKRILGRRRYDHLFYRRHYRRLLHSLGYANRPAEGESDYLARWRKLTPHVESYSYRLYSHFCGPTPDIIPYDLLHNIVEPALNPPEYWAEYEDKTHFATYVGTNCLPTTVAQRSDGGPICRMADECGFTSLVLKPAVSRSCGEGILRFERVGERFTTSDGTELTDTFLLNYGNDWVLQEAIAQHPVLQQLSPTAVATLRLAVYRSVSDGEPHLTAAVLRVGSDGAVVDNIVAGGRFVGIDLTTGRLNTPFIARFGERTDCFNGVDLSTMQVTVPAWSAVVALALDVARHIPHHHLLALDIAVTPTEKPMLIEYNIGGFSSYLFHFVGQTVFGPWTEEVVRYLSKSH